MIGFSAVEKITSLGLLFTGSQLFLFNLYFEGSWSICFENFIAQFK